ncbi:ABC transporter permease [Helicobacter jaachi]|uniref:ABC transporter permease n=1 Tax=Helicobacter jaachi TaxID=1677920 RepID=A0A4U8TAF2_9HELI|nr:ABC transporter permease [Helicobacter jaachi]TLD96795.1 ABC transporter permease [Helicobacter jaachi]
MLFLIQKEFKQILRGKFIPKLIVMFPIMVVLVMPFAANMEIKNINLGILDFDKSSLSRQLIAKIGAGAYFKIISVDDTHTCINNNQCDIVLEIPAHFELNITRFKSAHVGIYANAINATKGLLGSSYLANIIATFGAQKSAHINANSANMGDMIFGNYYFNPKLDYKIYMIPALLAMVLTMICGFLPAFNIVGEKQKGNLEQLNVTPISRFNLIIAKLIPYWIIGLIVITLCFVLAWAVYGFSSQGSYGLIYLFSLVYIFVVAGFGLVISNYSSNMQQAMFVMFFFVLILVLMSGLYTSVKSMPTFAQYLAYFNPLKYFIEALRSIFLKGSHLAHLWQDLLALALFAIALNLWAVASYKKQV